MYGMRTVSEQGFSLSFPDADFRDAIQDHSFRRLASDQLSSAKLVLVEHRSRRNFKRKKLISLFLVPCLRPWLLHFKSGRERKAHPQTGIIFFAAANPQL